MFVTSKPLAASGHQTKDTNKELWQQIKHRSCTSDEMAELDNPPHDDHLVRRHSMLEFRPLMVQEEASSFTGGMSAHRSSGAEESLRPRGTRFEPEHKYDSEPVSRSILFTQWRDEGWKLLTTATAAFQKNE
jgi:hypothetical protein